jgi:hypothetical protein
MIRIVVDAMLLMTGGLGISPGGSGRQRYQGAATLKGYYIYSKCDPASIDLPEEAKVTAYVKKTVLMAATCEDSAPKQCGNFSAVIECRSRGTQECCMTQR